MADTHFIAQQSTGQPGRPFNPNRPVSDMVEMLIGVKGAGLLATDAIERLRKHCANDAVAVLTDIMRAVSRVSYVAVDSGNADEADVANVFWALDLLGDVQAAMSLLEQEFPTEE